MAEKENRRKSTSSKKAFSMSGAKDFGMKAVGLMAGIALGTFAQKFIAKKDAVSGTDLLGLDGKTSKWTTPAILIAGGMAGNALVKQPFLKNVFLGVGCAGGVKLVNTIAGSEKISLSGDEEAQAILPGVGEVLPQDYLETSATTETPDGFQINGDEEAGEVNFEGIGDTNYSLINGTDQIL